jgi:hypothetical protein
MLTRVGFEILTSVTLNINICLYETSFISSLTFRRNVLLPSSV